MTTAKELLKQRYYEPIKEQPELFVGIELEYPVVNLSGNATDVSLTKQLLLYLLDNLIFKLISMILITILFSLSIKLLET